MKIRFFRRMLEGYSKLHKRMTIFYNKVEAQIISGEMKKLFPPATVQTIPYPVCPGFSDPIRYEKIFTSHNIGSVHKPVRVSSVIRFALRSMEYCLHSYCAGYSRQGSGVTVYRRCCWFFYTSKMRYVRHQFVLLSEEWH